MFKKSKFFSHIWFFLIFNLRCLWIVGKVNRVSGEFELNNHQQYPNLKNMKKRVSDRVRMDDDSNGKQKYQILLQDYLELQKELMSMKKKVEVADTKRGLLEAEVRFLRQRHRYLSTLQFAEAKAEVRHDSNAYDKPVINERRNHIVNESPIAKSRRAAKDFRWDALKRSKKPKNCLINGKEAKDFRWDALKSKNSWQDPLALRV